MDERSATDRETASSSLARSARRNMLTTDIGHDLCPHCGYYVDNATSVEEERIPSEGDWTICFKCEAVCRYTADLKMRVLTPEETTDIPESVQKLQQSLKSFPRNIGQKPKA